MDTMKTGSYLAALRKNAGMTQQEAADRLGVSNKTVSKWESGGGFPDIAILPALAELYGVTADDILAGETIRRAAASGGGQVEQYLARRGELRWQIGYAVAALCMLAGVLFSTVQWAACLLPAAAAAAIWVGWGSCPKDATCRRIAMLLPCGVMLVWIASYYVFAYTQLPHKLLADYPNRNCVVFYLYDFFRWDLTLLLLPPLYLLLRGAARKWSGERHLLRRPFFPVVTALWIAATAVEIVHWIVALPPTLAYAATSYPSYFSSYKTLSQDFAATLVFLRAPSVFCAAAILALTVTAAVSARKKPDSESAQHGKPQALSEEDSML